MALIDEASKGWIHKTKAVEYADIAPGPGSTYVELMIGEGWLEAHRDGRITFIRATDAGLALVAEGRDFYGKMTPFLVKLKEARR